MNTLVKICGISDLKFAKTAEKLGVDFLGFIFHTPSPRNISLEKALEITSQIKCKKVGVFVRQTEKEIREIADFLKLDVIQLHGQPNETLAKNLKKDYQVWQAFSDEIPENFPTDVFLIDSPKPGSGKKSNWQLAKKLIESGKKSHSCWWNFT